MVSGGIVRERDEDEGFEVIDSPDAPGGCLAVLVWPPGVEPGTPPSPEEASDELGTADQGTLTIWRNDGTVTTRSGRDTPRLW